MTGYAIRGGAEGGHRLDLLARAMAATTEALLARVGVPKGGLCIDLGCGAGHVTRSLAGLVGSQGRVLGLDFDPIKLAAARKACQDAGQGNVAFRVANVMDWAETNIYDLVYGRFILSHLPDRAALVRRMYRALRPHGLLVLEDIDFLGSFCYPPNPAFQRYCELYCAVVGRRGGDALLGPQLPGLCRDAGFASVEVRMAQPLHTGHAAEKALSLSTLVNIRHAVVAEELATPVELQETIAGLEAFTNDPQSIIGLPRIFQVWGRRPPGGP